MFRIKKSFVLIAIIIFILLTLCVQTIPKMQYYSKMRQSNLVELEALVKEYPNYPEAYILLGEKYGKSIPEKAAFNYKKAVEIVNNKKFEAAMDEYIAAAYLKNGNVVEAVEYYSNPILIKNNLTTNILLANILQTIGRYDEAIYVLDSFEKNDLRLNFYDVYKEPKFSKIMELLKVMDSIADGHNVPVGQVALNWSTQKEYVGTALVGVRSIEHADENCKTFDWKLTEEEMKILDSKIEECAL